MAAILRNSSAGQIGRLFLGMKIAPYEDEKEGFAFPQAHTKPITEASTGPSSDESPDEAEDESEKDLEKEGSDKDGEKDVAGAGHAAPPGHAEDSNIVGWAGPNDEDNPQNWSSGKKMFTFAQICLLTFASKCDSRYEIRGILTSTVTVYSASAIVTPAAPTFIRIFGISQQVSSLSLSMYVLGYVSANLPPSRRIDMLTALIRDWVL